MRRKAFTMMELVFVIVIIGIIAKFGVEFLIKAYDGYIFSTVQNRLQSQSEIALEQIANRLQYRIKSSVIVRRKDNNDYYSLSDAQDIPQERILEWIGYDIDGMRGTSTPLWSGFIDLDAFHTTAILNSPGTDTGAENTLINNLSVGGAGISGINDSALFFIGANSDIKNGYGWGGAITDQNQTMHPIQSSTAINYLASNVTTGDFAGQNIYEFYQLAWTAYALVYTGAAGTNDSGYISSLDSGAGATTLFDTNGTATLLATPIKNVTGVTKNGDWTRTGNNTYKVKVHNVDVTFTYNPTTGSFDCDVATQGEICRRLRN